MFDDITDDLAEARAKLEAAREALQAVLDVDDDGAELLRRVAERIEQIGAEVGRVEGVLEGQAVEAGRTGG